MQVIVKLTKAFAGLELGSASPLRFNQAFYRRSPTRLTWSLYLKQIWFGVVQSFSTRVRSGMNDPQ